MIWVTNLELLELLYCISVPEMLICLIETDGVRLLMKNNERLSLVSTRDARSSADLGPSVPFFKERTEWVNRGRLDIPQRFIKERICSTPRGCPTNRRQPSYRGKV